MITRFQEAAPGLYNGLTSTRDRQFRSDWSARVAAMDSLLCNEMGRTARAWENHLLEAMTMDDFPLLFGDTLNRRLRARYAAVNPGLMQICYHRPTRDFRENKTFHLSGMNGRLQEVGEKGERLAVHLMESKTSWYLKKYGEQADFSWEAFIGGEYGLFQDIPARMIDAATNTREWFLASLLCDAAGPLDATFDIATGTAPVSIAAIEAGIAAMASQTVMTETGVVPLNARAKYIIYPPALDFTVRKILGSQFGQWTYGGDDEAAPVMNGTTNVLSNWGLIPIMNEWLPIINAATGNTAWYLATDPVGSVPLLEAGGLMGREDPEIFMKASDKVAVGGAPISPLEGDFATDNIFYAIRYCFGGAVCDTHGGYASTGAGS